MEKFLLLSLIISAESLAAGVCIVCPPGYDCSGNKPVAHTGNARLATIGDIPTTAAQVGAATSEHTHAWSEITDIPVGNDSKYFVKSYCAYNNSEVTGANGDYCWCAKETIDKGIVVRASWVFLRSYISGNSSPEAHCSYNCANHCASDATWRASSVW